MSATPGRNRGRGAHTITNDNPQIGDGTPTRRQDGLIAIGEAECRIEAIAANLTNALVLDEFDLVAVVMASIKMADTALIHLRSARLASAA